MKYAVLLTFLGFLSACADSGENNGGGVGSYLNGWYDHLTNKGREAGASASGELEKLFTYEYKVFEFPPGSAAELELKLAAAGRDRWDCFHVERQAENLQVFCKRNPKTVLKYIPRVF